MPVRVFLCYSENDKDKMKSLYNRLERTEGLLKPIVAADRRMSLTHLSEKVASAIREADVVIPILTSKSIGTQWINQEIGYAKAKCKDIQPIVEKTITGKLKGFIHNQLDLPYSFESFPGNSRKRNVDFSRCCGILVNDLSARIRDSKYGYGRRGDEPPPLLIGHWRHSYFDRNRNRMVHEEARIDGEGNYFIAGSNRPKYYLRGFNPEPKKGIITLDKVRARTQEKSRERLHVKERGGFLKGSVKGERTERREYRRAK